MLGFSPKTLRPPLLWRRINDQLRPIESGVTNRIRTGTNAFTGRDAVHPPQYHHEVKRHSSERLMVAEAAARDRATEDGLLHHDHHQTGLPSRSRQAKAGASGRTRTDEYEFTKLAL